MDPISDLLGLVTDLRLLKKYNWDVARLGPATFPMSNYFRNQLLAVGDQINVITDDEIVGVVVVRIDGGVGPIVNEIYRAPRV